MLCFLFFLLCFRTTKTEQFLFRQHLQQTQKRRRLHNSSSDFQRRHVDFTHHHVDRRRRKFNCHRQSRPNRRIPELPTGNNQLLHLSGQYFQLHRQNLFWVRLRNLAGKVQIPPADDANTHPLGFLRWLPHRGLPLQQFPLYCVDHNWVFIGFSSSVAFRDDLRIFRAETLLDVVQFRAIVMSDWVLHSERDGDRKAVRRDGDDGE